MSQETGIALRSVQRYLKELKDNGILKREGSDINGEWIFLQTCQTCYVALIVKKLILCYNEKKWG